MKVKVEANELTDLTVSKVSLVKRGANREPFTLIKSESEVDQGRLVFKANDSGVETEVKSESTLGKAVKKLGEMFRSNNKQQPTTDVVKSRVSAVFVKDGVEERVGPVLEAGGFSISDRDVRDGVVIYKQDGYDENEEATVIRLNDAVSVGLTPVAKYFSEWDPDSIDFGEQIKGQGFYPAFNAAISAMRCCVENVLYQSDSASDSSSKTNQILSDFSSYVIGLVDSLPSTVFKLDDTLRKEESIVSENLTSFQERSNLTENVVGNTDDVSDIDRNADMSKSDAPEVFEGMKLRKVDGKFVESKYTFEKNESGEEVFIDWVSSKGSQMEGATDPVDKSDNAATVAPSADKASKADGAVVTNGNNKEVLDAIGKLGTSLGERIEKLEKAEADRKAQSDGTVVTKQTGTMEDAFTDLIAKATSDEEKEMWETEQRWAGAL